MKKDDPVTVAEYAKEKGLLKKALWKWAARYANSGSRRINRLRLQMAAKKQRTKKIRYQFGYRVPRMIKEAYELDRINGNTKWADAIALEVESLIEENKVFTILERGQLPTEDREGSSQHPRPDPALPGGEPVQGYCPEPWLQRAAAVGSEVFGDQRPEADVRVIAGWIELTARHGRQHPDAMDGSTCTAAIRTIRSLSKIKVQPICHRASPAWGSFQRGGLRVAERPFAALRAGSGWVRRPPVPRASGRRARRLRVRRG